MGLPFLRQRFLDQIGLYAIRREGCGGGKGAAQQGDQSQGWYFHRDPPFDGAGF
jgi:hypothetical protein